MELISSGQNPKIKHLLALQEKSSLRCETGLFVVEGRRELEHCLEAGYEIDTLFICPELFERSSGVLAPANRATLGIVRGGTSQQSGEVGSSESETFVGVSTPDAARMIQITKEIYSKVAYRGSTEGVIAEVKAKALGLKDLQLKENPVIVVLEGVEKPGNLGAVLRSADAAGADAVLVCDPLTDLYNPNLIRASIGAIFTVPTVACSSEEAIAWLKERGIRILTAQLQDSSLYYDTPMGGPVAIVMGTESTGLTQQWRTAADAHIRIPMLGRLDSLNVSVSAAILLFEALRQRQ